MVVQSSKKGSYMDIEGMRTVGKTITQYKNEIGKAERLIIEGSSLETVEMKSDWIANNKHYDVSVCKSIDNAIKETYDLKWLKIEDDDVNCALKALREHLNVLSNKVRKRFQDNIAEVNEETGGYGIKQKRSITEVMGEIPHLKENNWMFVEVAISRIQGELKRFHPAQIYNEWLKKMDNSQGRTVLTTAKERGTPVAEVMKKLKKDFGGIQFNSSYFHDSHRALGRIHCGKNDQKYLELLESHSKLIENSKTFVEINHKSEGLSLGEGMKEMFPNMETKNLYNFLIPRDERKHLDKSKGTLEDGRIYEHSKGPEIYKAIENYINIETEIVREEIRYKKEEDPKADLKEKEPEKKRKMEKKD